MLMTLHLLISAGPLIIVVHELIFNGNFSKHLNLQRVLSFLLSIDMTDCIFIRKERLGVSCSHLVAISCPHVLV